jgi:microcystin-dependent protein
VVIFDIPNMQVVGPSSGSGGGGGGGVDPTTIASTGDIKYRITGEVLTGWVKVNGRTIGSATSGATERANADTQNLFTYLWANCIIAHCPMGDSMSRSATALADFMANRTITLPDLRGRMLVGLDDMGAMAAGRIANSNITSGGGDLPITPAATGGEANHALTVAELAAHNHTATDAGHTHAFTYTHVGDEGGTGVASRVTTIDQIGGSTTVTTQSGFSNITVANTGGGGTHNTMAPFALGSWYIRL